MPLLSDYITSTRRLLRDKGTLYPDADLIAFINEARRIRDVDTRLVRKVMGFTLTANVSTYALSTIGAATFIRGETSFTNVKEIVSVYVLPMGGVAGGIGIRYPMARKPYSEVAALVSTSWPSYPVMYDILAQNAVVVAPPPAQAYASEWDVVGVFAALVNTTDSEPMGDPYNDAVPYMAAAIAKENAQRFDEAAQFEGLYRSRMLRMGVGIRQFAIPRPGFDLRRVGR